ncbi:zinc-binding dehydrogenase [Nocardia higoensis]|uniref:Zinc-binding dehydrogenase n=1 Tax=Nocardia higoensis TaxID=228599 RepID=A0ABS0D960_9NOCA|nr:zinc-binding dehydrogenase [Nocardia higoensis]MBF6354363.1 zinc-binding dehydrogenase [Nocardia higoensis]
MRAIVMTATGSPDVLVAEEATVPRAGEGEIVVRAEAIPVLWPELMLRSGAFPTPVPPPLVFGFQAAGTVVETGPGVDAALAGTRVVAKTTGSGAYAEFVAAPAATATPIPEGLDTIAAAAILMPGSVGSALLTTAALTGSETVLVQAGATGIGAYLVGAAKAAGAKQVIATAGGATKTARAAELGADLVIDHNEPQWPDRLRDLLDGTTVDVVFDSIGGPTSRALLEVMTPLHGRMLVYGLLSGAPAQVGAADLLAHGLTLIGCSGPQWSALVQKESDGVLARAASTGAVPHIDAVLPLGDAAAAHRLLESRRALGAVLLRPEKGSHT